MPNKRITKMKLKETEKERIDEDQVLFDEKYLAQSIKKLLACVHCHLLLPQKQWEKIEVCPNCPQMSGISDTTNKFNSVTSQIYPRISPASRFRGFSEFIPGLYAVSLDLNNELEAYSDDGTD